MKKNRGYLLTDALFGFALFIILVTLLYSSYIGLLKNYQNSQNTALERIKQWEEDMVIY